MGVGGIHEFPDFPDSTSSGYDKPWGNVEAKVCYFTNNDLIYLRLKFLKTVVSDLVTFTGVILSNKFDIVMNALKYFYRQCISSIVQKITGIPHGVVERSCRWIT